MTAHRHVDSLDITGLLVRLERFMLDVELAEVDLPHIVLSTDLDGGNASYSGPYATAIEALAAAEADRQACGGDELRFRVAPLYPPFEMPASADRGA